jgi:hypothetical protein
MRRIILSIVLSSFAFAAYAQPSPQPGAPAVKDRKDYLLEALESQRNDGLSKLAICYADANDQIQRLNAQLQKAQADLVAAKKPDAPPTPTPPAQP